MKKWLNITIWTILLMAISLTSLVVYWLTWPYKIAEQKQPAKILTPIVKNGGELIYELDYCKYINISPIETRRQLIDGVVYPLPVPKVNVLPVGCNKKVVTSPIIVPDCSECFDKDMHLELIAIYQINPLRRIEVRFITDHFKVIK